jgi:hypothetical protein
MSRSCPGLLPVPLLLKAQDTLFRFGLAHTQRSSSLLCCARFRLAVIQIPLFLDRLVRGPPVRFVAVDWIKCVKVCWRKSLLT